MANHDLTQLLNFSMPFAIESLYRKGEFQPFGMCMDNNNEVEPYPALIGRMRQPRRNEIDRLYRNIRSLALARKIKALCLCREVPYRVLNENTDGNAIHCFFEHTDGDALEIVLPFNFISSSSSFVFGTLTQKQRKPSYFVNYRSGQTSLGRSANFRTVGEESFSEWITLPDSSKFEGIRRVIRNT